MVLKKSTDGGKTFTQSSIVDTSPTDEYPRIVIDSGNNIYIFWKEDTNDNEILLRKSTDGGKSFAPEKQINISNSPPDFRNYNVAADSNNNLYLLWYGKAVPPAGEILLKKSTDGGKTFGSEIQVKKLVTDIGSLIPPIVAVDSKNNIFVSWNDAPGGTGKAWQILLTKSTDGGKTFTPEKQIHAGTIPHGIPHDIAAR